MRFFRPSLLTGWLYPGALKRIRTTNNILWLTFDDGPSVGSTHHLLEILNKHSVKAAFFCNGRAAEKCPDLMSDIRSAGHITGNHGYDHLDGWFSSTNDYVANADRAAPLTSERLFRPPYGRLTPVQHRRLKERYKIVLWDLMPYDFDLSYGKDNALKTLLSGLRSGSVVVLHDSPGSTAALFLDEFIVHALSRGFRFLSDENELLT